MLKIKVCEQPYRTVLFWLSKEESKDKNIIYSLQSQFKEWKAKKYQPVVFESGVGNLEDSIYLLLKHNYDVLAKGEVTKGL